MESIVGGRLYRLEHRAFFTGFDTLFYDRADDIENIVCDFTAIGRLLSDSGSLKQRKTFMKHLFQL